METGDAAAAGPATKSGRYNTFTSTKGDRIALLRVTTRKTKDGQSRRDYTDEIKHLEGLCEIEAFGDLFSHKKSSLLDDVPSQKCVASAQTKAILASSVVQQEFEALPPRIVVKKTNDIIKFALTEVNQDSKLVKALDFIKEGREAVDPPRLWFQAAILFDEINMDERALAAFIKGAKNTDPSVVVETYDLPITPEYLRKVRVMSKFQEAALLKVNQCYLLFLVLAGYDYNLIGVM
jgi:hypothetical protein